MKRFAIALLAVALPTLLWSEESPNLLKNGGFEEAKPDGKFEAWNGWRREDAPQIEHKVSIDAHSGKHSGHIITQGKGYHGGYCQVLKLKAGCRYRYSAWIKFKNLGTGKVRACYQETFRLANGQKHFPSSIAAEITKDCDWTYMENVFETQPDKDSDYSMHVVLVYDEAEVWVDDAEVVEYGPVFAVDNGKLTLRFGAGIPIVGVNVKKDSVASLQCKLAQFEKKGVGYKRTGTGFAGPARATSFDVKERGDSKCVVDVTCEWPDSKEAQRKFEAVYRITVSAGQPWFESQLLSIKNTDTVEYEVKGYYHALQPSNEEKASPRCFPDCAAWMQGKTAVGVAVGKPEDFELGLRKTEEGASGDVTRKLGVKIAPGQTWQATEPSIFVFAMENPTDAGLVEMQRQILSRPAPSGKLTYLEAKGAGK